MAEEEELNKEGEEHASRKRRRVCECGRDAVEKVVGPRSANRGLHYLCCDRFVVFGKKKNSCRFFEWIDQPRVSKEQKREAWALLHKEKEPALGSQALLLQSAIRTRNGVRNLEKQCENIEGLHVNRENFELETRVFEDGLPQTRVRIDVENACMGISIASQHGLIAHDGGGHVGIENVSASTQMTCNDGLLHVEHVESLPANLVEPEKSTCKLNVFFQQNEETAVEDVHGLNLGVVDPFKGVDTSDTQIGPSLSEVPKDKDTNQEGAWILQDASETPTCLCARAAVLKTVKSKGPNQGLRFWVCSNSQPFYVKKKRSKLTAGEKSCKFFRWIDTPFEKSDTQKNEEKQRRKEVRKRKEMSFLS